MSEHISEARAAPDRRYVAEHDRDILERYTDYISDDHDAFCWEYSLAVLDEPNSPVKRALLQGLKALSETRNARLRQRRFTICLGDNGFSYYFVAVTSVSADLTRFLGRFLERVTGYQTSEVVPLSNIAAVPRFRYEAGQVIEY